VHLRRDYSLPTASSHITGNVAVAGKGAVENMLDAVTRSAAIIIYVRVNSIGAMQSSESRRVNHALSQLLQVLVVAVDDVLAPQLQHDSD
jgi:uncharacterized membrane protein YoaK (UPF0700 family)